MSYSATITVPAGKVGSTLTAFVTRVDLAHMPAAWWADVASDGADIRVRQAGSDIPFYVAAINTTTKQGELWFKATLTTGENAFTVEVVDGATTPAVTDPIGRNAVFVDYDLFVLPGLAYTNLTGGVSPTATGTLPTLGPVSWSPAITAHQGITQDANGNWYGIDTDEIKKYDSGWNLLTTRSSANAATGLGTNHLGDGFVHNGELFTVAETYPDSPYDNVHVAVWNLSDLTFNRSYNLSAQAHEASSLTRNPNNGHWYITDYENTGDTALRQYDSSFNYVGTVTLSTAISNQQGIEYHDGYFYIASGDTERIYRCNLDGTGVTYVLLADLDPATSTSTELEGFHSDGTDLYVLYDHGATSRVHRLTANGSDGQHFDTRGYLKAVGLTKRTDWSMGVSALLSRGLESATGNNAILTYGTNNSTSANFANLVADYDATGDKYGIWNSTDSWLYAPTVVPTRFDNYRWHHTQQNTADRKVWRNGALVATDTGTAQRPASTGDTLFIGSNHTGATESYYGRLNRVYLRNGVLSADWLSAEYTSWETPSSFYTVSVTQGAGAGVSSAATTATVTQEAVASAAGVSGASAMGTAGAIVAGVGAGSGVSSATATPSAPVIAASGAGSAVASATAAGSTVARTNVTNHANRITVIGRGYVEPNPAVVPEPPTLKRGADYVTAFAYTAPAMTNGRPAPITPDEVKVKAHRDRILVGGKDVTFFRDIKTPMPGYKLIQPLGYDSMTLVFPQAHALFEQYGTGALKWLDKEKRVRIQRVEDGTVVGRDYYGVITAVRASGRHWVADVAGDLVGRAALRDRQLPLFRWERDLGRHWHAAMVELGLRHSPRFGPVTGTEIPGIGGMRFLDWVNHICTMAVKKNGDHYTVMPSTANPRVWEMRIKDTTTRHCSIYLDAGRMVPELADDLAEQPNRIYGTGVTPEGKIVKNGRYPGLRQAPPPAYPFADNRTFGVGTTDATAGIVAGSIHAMNWRLIGAGYLDREDLTEQFTTDTEEAVEDLQEDAGLTVTGQMTPATWDALFDNQVVGYSIRQSRVEPMAQRTYVKPWLLSASGARRARNPNHDPTRLVVDVTKDWGAGHRRPQMTRWARRDMNRGSGKNWVGTIRVETGAVVRGNHTPGVALTAGDVMPLRELRPGMNAWLPLFDGGTLVHIVGIDIDAGGRTGTLTVDTKYRDLLTVTEIIERNRESRRDPGRAFLNQHRSSKAAKDAIITFDEIGGLVFDKVLLPANEWTEFPVVGGQEGTIRRIETLLKNNLASYAITVWGKQPGEKNLAKKIGNPMPVDADGLSVWDDDKDLFTRKVLLYAAGTEEEPAGYKPKRHRNMANEVTTHPITGKWVDDAQFSYHTLGTALLWVAIYPLQTCELNRGRIMWPQLEAGS